MTYIQNHPGYRGLRVDEHLRLIEPKLEHGNASLSWAQSQDVIAFMGADFSNPTLAGEQKRIRDIRENSDEYSWMIELDGHVIGNVCVNDIAENSRKFGVRSGNLVILIGSKDHWGKGIATKVCRAVLDWAFADGAFGTMASRALEDNAASINTMKKLGFEEIGTEPFEGTPHTKPGTWRNFILRSS